MVPIKHIPNSVVRRDIAVTIREFLDHGDVLEESLKAGNEGEIVEDPPWATVTAEARLLTDMTSQAAFVLFGIRDAGVDTAMIFDMLDSRENLNSSEGDPFRAQRHVVGECSSQLMKCCPRHRACQFEFEGADVVTILIRNHVVS